MYNSEEKRIVDKANAGEDLEELQKRKTTDAPKGTLLPEQVEQFYAVTSSMEHALRRLPELELNDQLSKGQRYALEALYMANSADDLETEDDSISGMRRAKLLNQALIHLQPVLAMALRPDFKEGRVVYDRLVAQLGELKERIKQVILAQTSAPKKGKKKEEDDDDEWGDGDGDDSDDDDADADEGDTDGADEGASDSTDKSD